MSFRTYRHSPLLLLTAITLISSTGAIAGVQADCQESEALTAVDITFQVMVPAETPPQDSVYIAGDFQGWNPGDPSYRLMKVGGLLHEIILTFEVGTPLQFKFTRGDWSKVEKGPNGEEIPNRTHTVTEADTLDLTVASWADIPVGSTITGDVTLITVPGFLSGRRVWVYLPPEYHDEPERTYPVLYMLDGQNVFDEATSFDGEWGVDETCETLIPAGEMAPIIVVAVANGELNRIHEYTPWYDPDFQGGVGGGGEEHLQAFINTLLPFIDANYRTHTGPEYTGLAGSSLGGLMSMYAAYAHPEAFGRIGALSTSFWWKDHELLAWAATQTKPPANVYMDMGTLESGVMVDENGNGVDDSIDDLRAMRDLMVSQGFILDQDLMVVEDEGGQHNEYYWRSRFPVTLQYLFPMSLTSVLGDEGAPSRTRLPILRQNAPNPFNPSTTLAYVLPNRGRVELRIYEGSGRLMLTLVNDVQTAGSHEALWDGLDSTGQPAAHGVYFARLRAGDEVVTRKITLVR
ncbi:alpha/beta hydrolase-fold protein [Candidatus Eisenbacteria bacterium]|uniref:Alpha/beta hydrolase-fold protein n=1 Tax=Eiseniibacteriota bacterium TaxID=2212470 RepID=A0ABV6YJS8_UNCEI